MLRSYLRANYGEAEYSSARILRFNIRGSMQLQGLCNKRKETVPKFYNTLSGV